MDRFGEKDLSATHGLIILGCFNENVSRLYLTRWSNLFHVNKSRYVSLHTKSKHFSTVW